MRLPASTEQGDFAGVLHIVQLFLIVFPISFCIICKRAGIGYNFIRCGPSHNRVALCFGCRQSVLPVGGGPLGRLLMVTFHDFYNQPKCGC